MPKANQLPLWPELEPPPSTPALDGLNQRLSAYPKLRVEGQHMYAGDRLVATFHESLLGRQAMLDLQMLFCLAPDLLRNFI